MEIFNSIAQFISKLLQWWFSVMPWEQAVRVRKGNIVRVLNAGLYFKIPFLDAVYIQTTRMRMVDMPMQTMSTRDGHAITVKAAFGYAIADILTLYKSLYHPEVTLGTMIMGDVSEYIRTKDLSEVKPDKLSEYVNEKVSVTNYGLKDISVKITTFAIVKTFRLMQDHSQMYEGLSMQQSTPQTPRP